MTDNASGSGSMRDVGRSAALLTVAASLGQVFGIGRELFVAWQVATSAGLDALLVALVFPTMLSGFLASGAATALVPAYAEVERIHGLLAARRLGGVVLTWSAIIGVAIIGLLLLLAGPAVRVAGPGLDPSGSDLAASYLPVLAPILLFATLSGLISALFQVQERFGPIAAAWTIGPLASLIVTVGAWPAYGLTAFAIGLMVNALVTLGVLVAIGLRDGILPGPALRAPRDQLVDFARHAVPLTLSASILQFNLLADRAIASLLTTGAISALRFAENVIRLPLNTLGPAWSKAVYPALVSRAAGRGDSTVGHAAHLSLRYILAIFVPVSVATAALAPVLVDLAYRHGEFDANAAALTSGALAGFAPLVALTMIQAVLVGAHNARRRGVLLMTMGILNAILNLVFDVIFGIAIGVGGVALSSSMTLGIVLFAMGWRLDRLEADFRGRELFGVAVRAGAASLVASVPVALLAWTLPLDGNPLVSLGLLVGLSTLGLAVYTVVSGLIGLREPRDVLVEIWTLLMNRVAFAR